jgi:glycerol-3-phosphate acyltransferase PlsY
MKRVTINAIIDIAALISFIPSLISGLVLYLVLPSGGGRGNSYSMYLDIPRYLWVNMHDFWSFLFTALLILHLLLHGNFFRNITRILKGKEKSVPEE